MTHDKIKRIFTLCQSFSLNLKYNLLKMTKKLTTLIFAEVPETQQYMYKRAAFTLAEVLITLGIIGIVAAMTIPTLNKNIQHKILEVKFKKSVTLIQQLVLMCKQELDVENLGAYCSKYDKGYIHEEECIYAFQNQYKKIQSIKKIGVKSYGAIHRVDIIKTFNNRSEFINDISFNSVRYTSPLQDGLFLGFNVNDFRLNITVDTNGYSKPNKVGHDIFIFYLDKKDALTSLKANTNITEEDAEAYSATYDGKWKDFVTSIYGYPCNLTSTRNANGIGCAYYALHNKCAWNNRKTYWQCLP